MSNELAIATERGQSMAELMGVSNAPAQSATPAVARLNVNQEVIEKEVEMDGDILMKPVMPKGAYKLTQGDTVVYSKTASIRVFAVRNQWQRWNGDSGEMEKSVLSNSLNGDLKDSIGGVNLGRPSGYIEDFNALPEATKSLIRSVKRVKVYFGLVTLDNPVDANGDAVAGDFADVPFVFDVKNRDSLKALDAVLAKIAQQNMLPPMATIKLSPAMGKIPTGATFGYVAAEMGDKVDLGGGDNETLANFLEFIEYINGTILDKYNERSGDGLSSADNELIASIVEVEE
jgi:hypothetical protein